MSVYCRKYETESEKVLPFGKKEQLTPEEEDELKFTLDPKNIIYFSEDTLGEQLSNLKKFWLRVAKANMHRIKLEQCKRDLIIENDHYRNILKTKICLPYEQRLPLGQITVVQVQTEGPEAPIEILEPIVEKEPEVVQEETKRVPKIKFRDRNTII